MINSIAHTAFFVGDMEASLHFYCDILGFRRWFQLQRPDGEPWIEYLKVTDGQFIELFYGGVKKTAADAGYHHMCLSVEDIHKAAARMTGHGVPLDKGEPKQGLDHNWQFWVRDPDGNRIEFMQLDPGSPQCGPSRFSHQKGNCSNGRE